MDHVKLAFWWIALWLGFGLVLDGLMGMKQMFYLGVETRRDMWRLAHAHGVLLGAVFVLFERHHGFGARPSAERLVILGMALLPLGFFLGGLDPIETDPGLGVWLVPLGGFCYILGLVSALIGSARR